MTKQLIAAAVETSDLTEHSNAPRWFNILNVKVPTNGSLWPPLERPDKLHPHNFPFSGNKEKGPPAIRGDWAIFETLFPVQNRSIVTGKTVTCLL